jgi:hypothetical protein
MIIGRVCSIPDIFSSVIRFDVLIKRNGHDSILKCTARKHFDVDFLDQVEIIGDIETKQKFHSKKRVHFCNVKYLKRNEK